MKKLMPMRISAALLMLLLLWWEGGWAESLPDFTRLVEENAPAVVNISTLYRGKSRLEPYHLPEDWPIPEKGPLGELFRRFFEQGEELVPEETESLGSGFIISPDGFIITNHHVVSGADEIIVRLNNRKSYEARFVGSDEASDIALLKIEARDLPSVKIGDSRKLKIGAWVLAIGSPFGFDSTVTAGIVSAKGRSLPADNYVPYIQTDVAINPGNSGGPLFNLDGEVIGVNSQIFSRSGGFMGLSFAVPIELAINVVQQIKEKGRVSRGYLGVLIQDVDRNLAQSFGLDYPRGALVSKVIAGSPADHAGLRVGDIILSFNDTPIQDSSQLPPQVGASLVGQTARMEVLRNGQVQAINVKIMELPSEEAGVAQVREEQDDASRGDRLGLVVGEPTREERKALQLPDKTGVVVKSVTKGAAAVAGIDPGDAILMLGGQTVTDVESFHQLVDSLPAQKNIAVLVQKPQGPVFLALRIR